MPGKVAGAIAVETLDATSIFLELYREVAEQADQHVRASLPPAAFDCDYLFVPGLLTRWNTGYFEPNMRRLAALGLQSRLTWAPHTMGSIEGNAAAMRRELEESRRPLVVMGHSKGALDTSAALALWPELAPKVRAFVSIQSPILGSEVADWYRAMAFRRMLVRLGAKLTGGSEQAVWDMTTEARERFVEKNPFPAEVPAYSIVTTRTRKVHRFYVGAFAMARRGAGPNDGMVAEDRGALPGSAVIRLADMDHLDPVTGGDGIEQFFSSATFDAANLTEALVRLIFS